MEKAPDVSSQLVHEIHSYYHDLQYFVGALIQLSTITHAIEDNAESLRSRLSEINNLSVIMSAKTNFLKYLTSEVGDLVMRRIAVHRVIKRVISGARQIAASQKKLALRVRLEGESYGEIFGPDVFEIIPYLLLENAIKYSPNHNQVVLALHEQANVIVCRLVSLGPELHPAEESKIFESGFRGENAIRLTEMGTGMGLFHAKCATEMYRGSITVRQRREGPPIVINGIPFRQTEFTLNLPKAMPG